MPTLLSVNSAVPRPNPAKGVPSTGIDKRPVGGPVEVRAPGPRRGGLGSGLVGDRVFDARHHGGDDQALYAYAREDLDDWATELGRPLDNGVFGENLTTEGLDVTGALIGERWRIGPDVVAEVSVPRIPCGTFANWMGERGWIKRFTARAVPGTYLRVVTPGQVRAGQSITVLSRPAHQVTVGVTFRALTTESELLPDLLAAEALPADIRALAGRRTVSRKPGDRVVGR